MILEHIMNFQEVELVSARIMSNPRVYYLLLYDIMIIYMNDFTVIDSCYVHDNCTINFLHAVHVSMCQFVMCCQGNHLLCKWPLVDSLKGIKT